DGSKRCRHCGQELTPGHLQDEKGRRGKDVQSAEERLREVAAALQSAQREEKRLREEESAIQKTYQDAREEYREVEIQSQQARTEVSRLQGECTRAYGELPEEYQQRISAAPAADWLMTEYPTPQDLERLRAEADRHSTARQRLQNAESVLKQWTKLK